MDPQCHLTSLIIISCPKPVSSTHSVDQIWWFTSLPLYNIFTNGLSIWETFDQSFRDLWTYLFIITYLNVNKTFHLIDSKNLPGEFYVTTGPGFWALPELILLKNVLSNFSNNLVSTVALLVTTDVVPYFQNKSILYTGDYCLWLKEIIKKTAKSTIQKV